MPSLIRATNLWGYEEQVRRKGAQLEPLLSRCHLPPEERRDDRGFLVFRHFCELLENTAGVLGDPTFGMSLAAYQGMDILGPLSVIARSSATVGEAMQSIARYLYLHCPALGLSIERGHFQGRPGVRLLYQIDDEGAGYSIQAHELTLANTMQVLKLLCGEDFRPLSVHLQHSRVANQNIYRAMFPCRICFDQQWTGFCLPEAVFDLPLSSADHQTWELAERYLASQQAPNAHTLAEEVSALINTLLPTGKCTADLIASQLSMHKRTLQRRLVMEDTSYQQLLDEERKKMARQYLLEPNLKPSQIAGLLGYSEQSVFNRACRDWFGATPVSYRRQLLGG